MALAALPICWIARERLGDGSALILLAAYFVNRAILGAAFFDFHEIALAVPLLSFALYFCEHEMNKALVAALALAVLCKEEVALIVCGFGVYIWLRRGRSGLPLALLAAGLLVFMIDFSIVMPFFRGRAAPYADRYSYLGSTFPMIARTLVEHPLYVAGHVLETSKAAYILQLFGSVAFLPVFSAERLIPLVPILARIMLSGLPPEYSLDFHYSAPLVPFLFFSTVFGVERLSARAEQKPMWPAARIRQWGRRSLDDERLRRWFPFHLRFRTALMVTLLIVAGLFGGNPVRYASRPEPLSDASVVAALKDRVPPNGRLSADETLVPHFSQRDSILILPELNDSEFVLMDFAGDRHEYPLGREEHRRKLLELTLDGPYRIEWNHGGVLLLHKDSDSKEEPDQQLNMILFDFPRDSLQSGKSRTGRGRTTFTIPHLFPPGSYKLTFQIQTSRNLGSAATTARFAASTFESDDEEQVGAPKVLAEKTVFIDRKVQGRYSVHLAFQNPHWNLLQFQVLFRSRRDLTVESIEVRPEENSKEVLQALRDY